MVVKAEKPVNCTVVGDAMIGKSAMIKAFVDHTKPESSYVATTIETHEGMYLFSLLIIRDFTILKFVIFFGLEFLVIRARINLYHLLMAVSLLSFQDVLMLMDRNTL